jgi:hypothetical protein
VGSNWRKMFSKRESVHISGFRMMEQGSKRMAWGGNGLSRGCEPGGFAIKSGISPGRKVQTTSAWPKRKRVSPSAWRRFAGPVNSPK